MHFIFWTKHGKVSSIDSFEPINFEEEFIKGSIKNYKASYCRLLFEVLWNVNSIALAVVKHFSSHFDKQMAQIGV